MKDRIPFKRLAMLAAAVLFGFFLFSLAGLVLQNYQLGQRAAAVREEITQLKEENEKLATQVARLQTPAAVEDLARQQLGLAKEGEVAVVIDFGPGGPPRDVPTPTPTPRPNWEQWWDELFGY